MAKAPLRPPLAAPADVGQDRQVAKDPPQTLTPVGDTRHPWGGS